jgi:Asp-tRNA(Asn)/Glu-tRNA(Gln) amidotransferase A subunit family amidase
MDVICQNLADLEQDLLSQARLLDKVPVEQRGPLHGSTIGIQDIMDTKGMTRVSRLIT